MHVYIALHGYVYSYIEYLGTWEVGKTSSQYIYTQETSAYYTKLVQLWYSAT